MAKSCATVQWRSIDGSSAARDTIQILRSFLPDLGKLRERPRMHRQNPCPLSEILLNFTEVEQALRGTPLSSMCTDA